MYLLLIVNEIINQLSDRQIHHYSHTRTNERMQMSSILGILEVFIREQPT